MPRDEFLVLLRVSREVTLSESDDATDCDWLERAKLAQMAAAIAPQFLVFPCFRDARELGKLLADGWQFDYRSPTVWGMLDVCNEHLMQG
jgi:hypothetical protein